MFKKTRNTHACIIMLLAFFTTNAIADIVIIGNKALADHDISSTLARNLWLGKTFRLQKNGRVEIINQKTNSDIRSRFQKELLLKSNAQFNAGWMKIIFTGKAQKPKTADSDKRVIELVRKNKNMIGYISHSSVNDSIKKLLTIK